MASPRLIAVLSDLGTRDPALAQFKTAVLSVNPHVHFVDVTHDIRPHDLLEAAFTLERIYREFPTRTIFAVLVDQLRGAPRRPVLAVSMDYFYFAPDNGVLSFIFQTDPPSAVYGVTAEHYIQQPIGPLAHHRDVYGSAVGWLSKGIESSNFGEPIPEPLRTQLPAAAKVSDKELRGMVLHVDRYGGLVTNIPANLINAVRHELGAQVPFQARIGERAVPIVGGWAEGGPEVCAMYGPTGWLEVVAAKGEAARLIGAKRGDAVSVVFGG